ncbi:preprotein translocase subunit SecE [Sphingobacteriales bacterium UPWRP_1]|nr:preprotein translocase subunit SecE [Sphingobacteriales bacterium TSM_CSM]PSJ77047.1 preprotein translocase subunit SecE [Sphingobacteriales bacterium UPWRP_1]
MERIRLYIKETIHELLYKVSWPTWEELQASVMVVLIATLIFSVAIFLFDFIFGANPENNLFKGVLYYIYSIFS